MPLTLDGTKIAILEEISDQSPRACGDHDGIRFRQRLQPSGEVRRLTDD
jgi:hypothetical protein